MSESLIYSPPALGVRPGHSAVHEAEHGAVLLQHVEPVEAAVAADPLQVVGGAGRQTADRAVLHTAGPVMQQTRPGFYLQSNSQHDGKEFLFCKPEKDAVVFRPSLQSAILSTVVPHSIAGTGWVPACQSQLCPAARPRPVPGENVVTTLPTTQFPAALCTRNYLTLLFSFYYF